MWYNEISKFGALFRKEQFIMSEKRRDHKGRILRDGESQRTDLKYRFAYTDILGKRKEVTSWRLDEADPTPANKRKGPSLREMERQIEKDRYNHILSKQKYTKSTGIAQYMVELFSIVFPRLQ